MATGICRVAGMVLCVGFLLNGSGPHAQASPQWSEEACPPGPFSYCLVFAGSGTWTVLDRSWTALGILVHPWLIEIRDPYTGRTIGRIVAPGPRRFTGLPAFTPNGRLLAAPVDDGTVRVWEVESGRELWTLPGRGSAAFGPDGKVLAYLGPEGEIVVSDMETGREILTFREFEPCGGAPVIGFSPDGRWLVGAIPWWVSAVSGEQTSATWASVVWDMTTGHVARVFPGWLFFLPDGQFLAAGSARVLPSLELWDGPRGAKLRVLRLPWLQAGLLSVSPDGQHAAVGFADGTIRFWKLGAEQEVALLDLKAVLKISPEVKFRLAEVWFSPGGDLLLTAVWTPVVGNLLIHLWHVGDLLGGASAQP